MVTLNLFSCIECVKGPEELITLKFLSRSLLQSHIEGSVIKLTIQCNANTTRVVIIVHNTDG